MIKLVAGLIFTIFLFSNIAASCNSSQIDINTAPTEDLDNIIGVGSVIAQNIINSRPFYSLDDLIKVSRIGNKTLEKIRSQGLACISDENLSNDNTAIIETNGTTDFTDSAKLNDTISDLNYQVPQNISKSSPELIVLNSSSSKDIKSNDNVWSSERIALYGFIAFTILLGFLFAAKKIRRHKTEFQE
jgi:competence ComEA-like helix-hairpin-helix protein